MNKLQLKVLQYELEFDDGRLENISLNRIYGIPYERWGIRYNGSVLGKTPDEKGFYFFIREPMPSSRDDAFYAEFRWNSAEEALEFWDKNRKMIIVNDSDYQGFCH